MKTYKDELGHRYGDFVVIGYTSYRVPSNGCVIWECKCVHCGRIFYKNGNHLRFDRARTCPACGTYAKRRR